MQSHRPMWARCWHKFMMQTDYFMEGVVADGIVRELWVSRKAPKKIIQASIKAMWFPVTAMINE